MDREKKKSDTTKEEWSETVTKGECGTAIGTREKNSLCIFKFDTFYFSYFWPPLDILISIQWTLSDWICYGKRQPNQTKTSSISFSRSLGRFFLVLFIILSLISILYNNLFYRMGRRTVSFLWPVFFSLSR